MSDARKKVVIATPSLTKPLPEYISSLEACVSALEDAEFDLRVIFELGNPYISNARATMLRKALDGGADSVVFIDHDLSFRPEDLLKLIDAPADVVAGLYRFKKDDEEYMGAINSDQHDRPVVDERGYISATRVPAGFLKVTKEAVDRFMDAYPELCYGPRYNPSVDLFNHGAHERRFWGEDYAFSRRWIDCGGEIWIVPDLSLTHHSPDKAYPGNYDDFLKRQPGGCREGQPAWWDRPNSAAKAA